MAFQISVISFLNLLMLPIRNSWYSVGANAAAFYGDQTLIWHQQKDREDHKIEKERKEERKKERKKERNK
jgi:hypothetical protein